MDKGGGGRRERRRERKIKGEKNRDENSYFAETSCPTAKSKNMSPATCRNKPKHRHRHQNPSVGLSADVEANMPRGERVECNKYFRLHSNVSMRIVAVISQPSTGFYSISFHDRKHQHHKKKHKHSSLISRGECKEKGRRKEKNSEDDPLKKRRKKKKPAHASGQSYRGEGKRWRLLAGL